MNQCGVLRGHSTLVSVDTPLEIYTHILNSLFTSLLRQRVLKSERASESPRKLVETLKLDPAPEFLIQAVGDGAQELAFLIILWPCCCCLSGNHTLRTTGPQWPRPGCTLGPSGKF